MRPRLLLLAPVLVALGLGLAQPAAAVTRAQARKVALGALKASRVQGPAIVFGLPRPLPKGSAVSEAGPGPSHRGKATTSPEFAIGSVETFVDTERRLPAGTWLFWMDLAPYARFEHPSVLVLVDAQGKVVRKQSLAWWPLVSGKRPAFLAPAAYRSSRYRVFSRGAAAPARRAAATPAWLRSLVPSSLTAGTLLPNDCIVVLTDEVDPIFTGDIQALDAAAKALGIPETTARNAADLEAEVTKLANGKPACTDVVLYLDAHGFPATGSSFAHPSGTGNIPESDHAQVALKHTSIKVDGNLNFTTTTTTELVDAPAVRKVMADHANLTFKLVVDACFSGRWTELSDQPNLRVILTASRSDQMAFGYRGNGMWRKQTQRNAVVSYVGGSVDVNVANTYAAGGFTNAITAGLTSWIAAPGATDLAAGLVNAFDGSASVDASQLIGLTAPTLRDFTDSRPHAAPPGLGFDVTVAMSYRHIAPGSSEACILVRTSPQRPGAKVHLRVAGPGVVSGSDQTSTLGADGTLLVRVPIDQYGDYTAGADVDAGNGETQSGAGQETVTAAQGDCAS